MRFLWFYSGLYAQNLNKTFCSPLHYYIPISRITSRAFPNVKFSKKRRFCNEAEYSIKRNEIKIRLYINAITDSLCILTLYLCLLWYTVYKERDISLFMLSLSRKQHYCKLKRIFLLKTLFLNEIKYHYSRFKRVFSCLVYCWETAQF